VEPLTERTESVSKPLLGGRALTVRYGATTALAAVDIDLHGGEVHAVVGENGAGKSTLLRALAGVAALDAGMVRHAPGKRIAWAPQEPSLPPDLKASEWIFLGCELKTGIGWLRRRDMDAAALSALQALQCAVSVDTVVGTLPPAPRKQLQLARVLRGDPEVLMLDEPTAVLGDAETRALFTLLRRMRQRGAAILYVSHRLEEILAIADRVTVLRDGQRVSTDPVAAVDSDELVRRMVGRDVPSRRLRRRTYGEFGLNLSEVVVAHVGPVSVQVRAGEIVGLGGLVGAGRSEILECVAGLRSSRSGRVESTAKPMFLPEDRGSKGLVAALSLRENLFLPAPRWLLRRGGERQRTREWIDRLRLRCDGTDVAVDSLSGGNQQKLLLARTLRQGSRVLLLDEPTAGVDVGAKAEIHDLIRGLADDGAAILLASSDLPELLVLCDRIVALRQGSVVGAVDATEATEETLAAMITGAHPRRQAES
jgi:rhamnose transport system ATP-binding protein